MKLHVESPAKHEQQYRNRQQGHCEGTDARGRQPLPDRHFRQSPEHLHRADQGAQRGGLSRAETLGHHHCQQVDRHGREHERIGGEGGCQQMKRGIPHGLSERTRRARVAGGRGGAWVSLGKYGQVQRYADEQVDAAEDHGGVAPPERVDQYLPEGPEHGARKASEQREHRDRAPVVGDEGPCQHGKGGLVQRARHCDSQQCPDDVELGERVHVAQCGERQRCKQRTGGHQRPTAPTVDESPDHRSEHSGQQQGPGERTDHGRLASSQCLLQRLHHQWKQVVDRAPRGDLGNAQCQHGAPGFRT